MSLKYHIVSKRDMRKDAAKGATLLYPQVRSGGRISYRELCEALSQPSSASPGDVSCVLRGLLFIMQQQLVKGNVVQLGDLGTFRMMAGSKGVESPEAFHPSLFKKARILYTPGVLMQEIPGRLRFEKLAEKKVLEDCA